MIILRDYKRTEDDDFKLNVAPYIRKDQEAVPQYNYVNTEEIVSWHIQYRYE